jgi:anti-sigma factor RsiW
MTLERDDGLEREHAAFADWDGAYVLGALAPDERRAYEDHLAGCARCRAAVAELAPLPGLLARARPTQDDAHVAPWWDRERLPGDEPTVADERTTSDQPTVADERTTSDERTATDERTTSDERTTADEPGAAGGPRPDLVELVVRRERRHRMRRRVLAGLVAVLVVGLAVAAPPVIQRLTTHTTAPAQTVALTRQIGTPLTASVAFTPTAWGTRLSMECDYPATTGSPTYGQAGSAGGVYTLVVTDVEGRSTQVSTWSAQPGLDVHLDAATAVPLGRIASVAIQSASGTAVLAARLTSG